jgi:hypothetical protein
MLENAGFTKVVDINTGPIRAVKIPGGGKMNAMPIRCRLCPSCAQRNHTNLPYM